VTIVSVSGACSRSGKTALAVTLLRELGPGTAAAVKFTTTGDVFERCPRGTTCVVCDIEVPFRLVEEEDVLLQPGTDTERLAAAGASRVLWAIARSGAVGAAWSAVRARLSEAPLIVMEGSTIVHTARPEMALYVVHPFLAPSRWKEGAGALMASADAVVVNRPSAEPRPPAPAVLEAVRTLAGARAPVVADVTRPLAEWAPALRARLHGLAARTAPAAGAHA
jgi:hypothetical protein